MNGFYREDGIVGPMAPLRPRNDSSIFHSAPHFYLRISIRYARRGDTEWYLPFLVTRWRFELQTHCLKGNCSAN